jgi:outer membrane protein TolC
MTTVIFTNAGFRALYAMATLLACLSASASTEAQPVRALSDILTDALRNSSDVSRLDRDLSLRLADAIEIETRSNPEVEVMARYSDKGEGAGVEFEVSQPLRFSDFTLRPLYAAAIRQTATVEQEAGLFDLVNRVTELYIGHWAAQSREAMARKAADDATAITERIEKIRREQTLPTVQFNVFVPEALRRREEATLHAAERAGLEARIAFETAGDGRAFTSIASAPSPLPPLERILAFAAQKDFGARLARARITVNEARLKVAEKDRMPLISPRASYEIDPGGADRVWGVGIAVEIPLWDRNGAEVSRAQGALREARQHLAQLNGGAREAMVAGLYRQVALLDARAESYNRKIVPAYRQTYQDIRAMYDQGQTDLLDLWQVQASLLDAEEDAISTVIDALTARVSLERAIGGKIEQVN